MSEKFLVDGAIPEYKTGLGKFLNVVAFVLIAVLILVIYLPTQIWKEQEEVEKLSRKRMNIINKVENFYNKMSDTYNEDPVMAIKIITALRDSTMADSNFYGKQTLKFEGKEYEFDVLQDLFKSYDTSFAFSYNLKDTVVDTLYKVTRWNESLRAFDTLSVSSTVLSSIETDTILEMETVARPATITYHNQYYLTDKYAYRPLINKKYIVEFSKENPVIIKDPIDFMYEEPRYVFFTFQDTSHGYIKNGEASWK